MSVFQRAYCNFMPVMNLVNPLSDWENKKTFKSFDKLLKANPNGIDPNKYPTTTLMVGVYRNRRKMDSGMGDFDNEYMISLTYVRGYLLITSLSAYDADNADVHEIDAIVKHLGHELTLKEMRKEGFLAYDMKICKSRKPIHPNQ